MTTAAEYKIEDGVPVPGYNSRQTGFASILRSMKVGESILVADRRQANIASQSNSVSRLLGDGRKYTTRTVEGGVRIWRIA